MRESDAGGERGGGFGAVWGFRVRNETEKRGKTRFTVKWARPCLIIINGPRPYFQYILMGSL